MKFCTSCGARLVSTGRFCTSCGALLAVPDSGLTPPATATKVSEGDLPPSVASAPADSGFPATSGLGEPASQDGLPEVPEPTTAEQALPWPRPAPLWQIDDDEPNGPVALEGRGGLVAVLVAVIVILGVAAVIVVHRTYGGGDEDSTTATQSKQSAKNSAAASAPSATPTDDQSDQSPSPAAGDPVVGTAEPGLPSDASDIAAGATVTAPPSARGHVDEAGRAATYPATAMLDSDPATAWRMDGDGTGETITLSFGRLVNVTGLALDPGFDKVSSTNKDRWPENRRISAATFTMDDGSAFTVGFATDADLPVNQRLQTFVLPAPVATTTITVNIDATVPARRGTFDTTAISRLAVLGS